MDKIQLEDKIVELLKTVYDPEIPVNVYDLGLIYRIELSDDLTQLDVDMTMTAPSCPMADFIIEDVRQKLESIEGLTSVNVNLVFEPEWTQDMMTEEAKLELGLLCFHLRRVEKGWNNSTYYSVNKALLYVM